MLDGMVRPQLGFRRSQASRAADAAASRPKGAQEMGGVLARRYRGVLDEGESKGKGFMDMGTADSGPNSEGVGIEVGSNAAAAEVLRAIGYIRAQAQAAGSALCMDRGQQRMLGPFDKCETLCP